MTIRLTIPTLLITGAFLVGHPWGILKAEPSGVPKAMYMPTDAGEVVLYDRPCPKEHNVYNFEYYAEATDGAVVHKGCWDEDGERVHIWFYNEPRQPFMATFAKTYFSPKPNM